MQWAVLSFWHRHAACAALHTLDPEAHNLSNTFPQAADGFPSVSAALKIWRLRQPGLSPPGKVPRRQGSKRR